MWATTHSTAAPNPDLYTVRNTFAAASTLPESTATAPTTPLRAVHITDGVEASVPEATRTIAPIPRCLPAVAQVERREASATAEEIDEAEASALMERRRSEAAASAELRPRMLSARLFSWEKDGWVNACFSRSIVLNWYLYNGDCEQNKSYII